MSMVNPVVGNALERAKVVVSVELGTTALTVKEIFGMDGNTGNNGCRIAKTGIVS